METYCMYSSNLLFPFNIVLEINSCYMKLEVISFHFGKGFHCICKQYFIFTCYS